MGELILALRQRFARVRAHQQRMETGAEYTADDLEQAAAELDADGHWSAAATQAILAALVREGRLVAWVCSVCGEPALTDPRWCDADCRTLAERGNPAYLRVTERMDRAA